MMRRPQIRSRGTTSLAIVSLSVAALLGATHLAERTGEHAPARVAISVAEVPSHSNSVVTRSKLMTSRFGATRSVREWRVVTDAFLLGAGLVLAANLWRRRAGGRLHDQLRVDAVFARRRGPPLVHIAR